MVALRVCVLERFGFGFFCSVSCRFLYTRVAGFFIFVLPFFVLLKYVSFEDYWCPRSSVHSLFDSFFPAK